MARREKDVVEREKYSRVAKESKDSHNLDNF